MKKNLLNKITTCTILSALIGTTLLIPSTEVSASTRDVATDVSVMDIDNSQIETRGATDEHYELVTYSKEITSRNYVRTITVSDSASISLPVSISGVKINLGYTHTVSGQNKVYKVKYKITAKMKVYDGMGRYLRTITQVVTPTVTEYEPI